MSELTPSLHTEIIPLLKTAKEFRIAVAMMTDHVLETIEKELPSECEKKYLVGINLPTHPDVLTRLLNFRTAKPKFQARVYKAKENYHPKVYIIKHKDNTCTTLLGSANATRGGWFSNVEMNSIHKGEKGSELIQWFDGLFSQGIEFDDIFINRYKKAFRRNKSMERTMRSNLDHVFENSQNPPPNITAITSEQFFRISDFQAYAPPTHAIHDDITITGRKQVRLRLRELDDLIFPVFSEYGMSDLHRHYADQFRTARVIRPRRGNIRDAIWLHYGKSESELKLYPGNESFTDHIRIQVILRHIATTAFIGTWIYVGKSGGSRYDREYIQNRLDSAGFLTTLLWLLKDLGDSYSLYIGNNHEIEISKINNESSLKRFLLYDKENEFQTDFKIARNYPVDHADLSIDKIEETTLLEFTRLYRIFQMFRHRMPLIKPPADCTADELKAFMDLVFEGGQVSVSEKKLKENIDGCLYLAFQYQGSDLAGISAIKQHTVEHVRDKPFKNYKIANVSDEDVPLLELGYSVTKSKYRGNGINSILNDELLARIKGRKVYATTGIQPMKKYLTKRGFEIKGQPRDGKKSPNIEYYEKLA